MAGLAAGRIAGERALVIDTDGWSPSAVAAEVTEAAAHAGVAIEDLVPGAATVLVVVRRPGDLASLQALLAAVTPPPSRRDRERPTGEEVEIPVVYDGSDLDEVAAATGLRVADVVAIHQEGIYVADFCGFAPGFAYLSGLAERLQLPRRGSPRPAVPAGSVAIADRYTAVYPGVSPGGWHLLGRTGLAVWDQARTPPALLRPGTRVRFVADTGRGAVRPGGRHSPRKAADRPGGPPASSPGVLEVLDGGLLTTVQDAGRPGRADQGVGTSGWLDPPAAALANRLVANPAGAAVLEVTLRGPSLVLRGPQGSSRSVAVTGGSAEVTIDGRAVAMHSPVEVPAGARIDVGWLATGARAYVAVSGGLAVDAVLGSRATDLLSGLGPPPLAAGQRLPLGDDAGRRSGLDVAPVPALPSRPVLRVIPGPRADWLAPGSVDVLTAAAWIVGADSNRVGLRLAGAVLERRATGELPPEGLVAGAVQVPPSGEPIVFLADHPVTGGYPVLAVVVDADLPVAAQLRPGTRVTFARAGRRG